MTNLSKKLVYPVFVALCLSAVPLFAGDHRIQGSLPVRDDASTTDLVAVAKVAIRDAIAAAEKACPGTVVEAQLDEENRFAVWEVKVLSSAGRVVVVYVDAGDGKVLLTTPKR